MNALPPLLQNPLKVLLAALLGLPLLVAWAVTWLFFYAKGVHPLLLLPYGLLSLCLLVGLLTPAVFGRIVQRNTTRWWAATVFGLPAGALAALFYFLEVFAIQDLRGIILLLLVAAAACLLLGLVRPAAFGRLLGGTVTRARALGVLGVPVIALLLCLLGSLPVLETYRLARLGRAAADRQHAISSVPPSPAARDGRVKVLPLHVGDTVVAYGQFYGGLDGWEGLQGYLGTLLSRDRITVPIYAYLVDHPAHGLMLVDAGICWEQAHDHDRYYGHNLLARLLNDREEYLLAPAQELEVQLARLGYTPAQVKTVFLTHVHDDHAGGLRLLPNATVVVAEDDWERGVLYGPSFDTARDRLALISYDSGPFGAFQRSQDYFGDGSIRLLASPGHSPGHTAVLLQAGQQRFLFAGDNTYTLRHLAVDQVRQLTIGGQETAKQLAAIRAMQRLLEELPGTLVLPAHDHTDYQAEYLDVFLADGRLSSQERQAIAAYEARLFTNDWRLRPGNHPYFVPAGDGERTGTVRVR
jgi:glyoxylase-like metal-dependent hydrolase (beta-lactamase superfamily II)